VEGSGSDLI